METEKLKFDDVIIEDDGYKWTQLCDAHADQITENDDGVLERTGSGICGVIGCTKESNYYYTVTTTQTVKKINLDVSWESVLGTILFLLESGDYEGRKTAKEELLKMAKAADLYNKSVEDKQ